MSIQGDSAVRRSIESSERTGHPHADESSEAEARPDRAALVARLPVTSGTGQARDYRLYSGIPGMLSVTDEDGLLIAVSDHWLRVMGYQRDEVIGTHRSRYFSSKWFDCLQNVALPELDRQGFVDGAELELIRKDGTALPVLVSSKLEVDPANGRRRVVTVSIDLSERHRAERALRESEERFRALFEYASDLVFVVDQAGMIRLANPSTLEVLGYKPSEIVGSSIFNFMHPDDLAKGQQMLASLGSRPRAVESGEIRARASDGNWRSLVWSARNTLDVPGIDGIFVSARDMTQFRRLEAQLSDARRLHAIGSLAGGIAHDVNNILGAILGFAKFLCEDLGPETPQRTYADRIAVAGERGRDLIHQIFAFSRAGRVERQPQDVVALADETVQALPALLPGTIRLAVRIERRPLVAQVNGAQIQQLLMNLAINARDALRSESGQIDIEVAEAARDDEQYRQLRFYEGLGVHPLATGGNEVVLGALETAARFVRITVADSGIGMSADTLANAFEPFFTTKSRATGTGLGLATVRNIVAAVGGSCVMRSELNRGTTVSVWLPLLDMDALAAAPMPSNAVVRAQGRVLVIDDESDLADATAIGLRRLGYEAVAFNDPSEALRQFSSDPNGWKSVISDHRMPGMTGLQLLDAMRSVCPKIDFILCSGYTDTTIEHMAFQHGASHFFLKPVDVRTLATAVEAAPSQNPRASAF